MDKADGRDTANRVCAIVSNSLDTQAKTHDLARQAHQSRTQFHRLFRTVVEETPGAMRRRLLLERAAYQLAHTGMSVTDVALNTNYGSLEAFTRAFRKAFRTSPSLYRRIRDPHFHLATSNKIHFLAPGSPTKGERDMDPFDRFAGNDSWHTRRLLEYASTLTEEQLDQPLPTVVELLPWRESNKSLRQLLENIIFTKEVWTAALSGADMDMNGPPKSQRSPQAMLQRLEKTDAELHRILSDVRRRSAWDDTFVDARRRRSDRVGETKRFGAGKHRRKFLDKTRIVDGPGFQASMQMQVEEFREKRSHEISGCDFNLAKTSARREISHAGLMLAITL